MISHQDLLNNIILFDFALRKFAEKHPDEFNLHLEFPTINRQKLDHEQLDGYLKETLYYTALAIDFVENLSTSQENESMEKLKNLVAPKLLRNINDFLNIETIPSNTRILCLNLMSELQDITNTQQ